eukprot:3113720-Rhodomonas_salina.2
MLREVLASDTVTEKEKRNLLQCRGTTYPMATIVCCNNHGATDATFPLCKQAEETISHMLMHCQETEGERHRAHDQVADPLLSDIASEAEGDWLHWHRQVAWKIQKLLSKTAHPPRMAARLGGNGAPERYPTTLLGQRSMHPTDTTCNPRCPEEIAMFVPDCLLWERLTKLIVIYEYL